MNKEVLSGRSLFRKTLSLVSVVLKRMDLFTITGTRKQTPHDSGGMEFA